MLHKCFTLTMLIAFLSVQIVHAKIWRVNNNVGITADFTSFSNAANAASVVAGDTLHIEASATPYVTGNFTLTKRLIVIGVGYFLDPLNPTIPGNAGLQATTQSSVIEFFNIGNGANGSKFLGVTFENGPYLNASVPALNLVFEKCLFSDFFSLYLNDAGSFNGITVRKCILNAGFIAQGATSVVTNLIIENNIFLQGGFDYQGLTGPSNIFRNNSINATSAPYNFSNIYIANNIFGNVLSFTFTNTIVKNNLFTANPVLPGGAAGNLVNVNLANVYVGGATGSLDSRMQLKTPLASNPAFQAGLTVGAVVTPNAGAFGGPDPYKLSGIPNIPSIYTLTVPSTIPAGSTSMNASISTRNNN